ncbi:ATP-dependent RNA helicase [Candidatus Saccharibacteria bacterium]|nr:ATP-dependent RNA helicase [Candidatus Saccharibacteria bacterium]
MTRCPAMPRGSSENFNKAEYVKKDRHYDQGGHTVPRSPDSETLIRKTALQKSFRERVWGRLQQERLDLVPVQIESDNLKSEIIRSVPEPFTYLELGRQASEFEPELPVLGFKDVILESIDRNQVTIITAETGAGKSTQVPAYLAKSGYNVSMTQPRRISASAVAGQIQREATAILGYDAEGLVACHTAGENTIVEGKTRITVLTDGLRLVQEFGRRDELEHEVLIIDEVHERNGNIDMLMAQVRRLTQLKSELRVVIMSATMEAEKLSDYFANGDERPPIINIPGRNYEVERSEEPDSTIVEQASKYAQDGHNILIFLPGVREIEDTMSAIKKELDAKGVKDATILPLHSKLSKKEQEAVMSMYPGPKIICATNIAQTSITIPDVTVVLMSGLERRTEIDEEGVQSLNLRPVSRADMNQQSGRCGRVEDGIAVLTRLNKDTSYVADRSSERTNYPIPEILRTDVDRNVLLAASAGLNFSELEFLDPIEPSVVERSKRALLVLGALDEDGIITNLGLRMIKLPMRPMYARMMTYAEDQGYNANVRTYMTATVASMEVGGLQSWLRDSSREWRDLVDETNSSDQLSQLDLFIAAQQLPEAEKARIGLDVHNFERSEELFRRVCKRSKLPVDSQLVPPNAEERQLLRNAITAGMIDYVYSQGRDAYTRVEGASGAPRKKSNRTTVLGQPPLVVGNPFGVERTRGGIVTQEAVLGDVTAVSARDLGRIATSLCSFEKAGKLRWSNGRLKEVRRELFKSSLPTGIQREEDAEPTPVAIQEVERYVMSNSGRSLTTLKECKKTLEHLQRLTTDMLPMVTQDDLESIIQDAMKDGKGGVILDPTHVDYRIHEIAIKRGLILDDLISPIDRQKIYENAPRSINVANQTFQLNYSNGIPHLHVDDPIAVIDWPDTLRLPDGRPIKLIYERHTYTATDLRQVADQLMSLV